jgi:hypothetical protein
VLCNNACSEQLSPLYVHLSKMVSAIIYSIHERVGVHVLRVPVLYIWRVRSIDRMWSKRADFAVISVCVSSCVCLPYYGIVQQISFECTSRVTWRVTM